MPAMPQALPLTLPARASMAALLAAALPALAQTAPPQDKPATEQVIVPQVQRREVKLPKYPSNDFSLGVFTGTYTAQNFGTKSVSGVRLGYHITEDIFFEGTYGKSKVSDEAFRQIFPSGGIFTTPTQKLSYYNVLAGYNLLPGEVFFARNWARASQGYIVAGVGSTNFATLKRQTITAGFGLRVIFTDWFAMQADVRDHVYSIDLLGKRQSTQNPEVTLGLTLFF